MPERKNQIISLTPTKWYRWAADVNKVERRLISEEKKALPKKSKKK